MSIAELLLLHVYFVSATVHSVDVYLCILFSMYFRICVLIEASSGGCSCLYCPLTSRIVQSTPHHTCAHPSQSCFLFSSVFSCSQTSEMVLECNANPQLLPQLISVPSLLHRSCPLLCPCSHLAFLFCFKNAVSAVAPSWLCCVSAFLLLLCSGQYKLLRYISSSIVVSTLLKAQIQRCLVTRCCLKVAEVFPASAIQLPPLSVTARIISPYSIISGRAFSVYVRCGGGKQVCLICLQCHLCHLPPKLNRQPPSPCVGYQAG